MIRPWPTSRPCSARSRPEAIGFSLPHEHTRCVLWHVPDRWDYWELTGEDDLILPELARFRELGGTCLVDVTLPEIGRDPGRLRRLAEASGLHLVMGCGWYRQSYYPVAAEVDRRPVEALADALIEEIVAGAGGTGIRPGIIGEIGTDKPWLTAQEERVFRAVARASRATGLAVTTHAVMSDVGLAQLRVLEDAGADPSRVVIGHADSYPDPAHWRALLERGASIEIDFLGMSFTPQERMAEPRLIPLLLDVLADGFVDRVLLSQDVCHNQQLRHYGGGGYAYLQEAFLPRLRAAGVGQAEIDRMTIDNPRRVLAIAGDAWVTGGPRNPWRRIAVGVPYENPWIRVEHHDVIRPDGQPGIYGLVRFRNAAVGVVAIDDRDRILLVGQWRYALDRYSWEIPEGGVPLGTPLLDGAQRELAEETGFRATDWREVCRFALSNSVTDEEGAIFVAAGLEAGEASPEPTEDLALRWVGLAEAVGMIDRGEITDAMSQLGILRVALERARD